MMRAWRIATDTPDCLADDLSGAGAKLTGGRWKRPGLPVVYCAESASLACLETLVYLGPGGLPLNRYLVAVDIPDRLWRARETRAPASLPAGWDAAPAGAVSLDSGDDWLSSKRSAILSLLSAIVPEDSVILFNPLHAHAAGVMASKTRRWLDDPRLF